MTISVDTSPVTVHRAGESHDALGPTLPRQIESTLVSLSVVRLKPRRFGGGGAPVSCNLPPPPAPLLLSGPICRFARSASQFVYLATFDSGDFLGGGNRK